MTQPPNPPRATQRRRWQAFNADDQLVATGHIDQHSSDYLTLGAIIDGITASGLAHSATTVQLATTPYPFTLVAEAVRSAPDGSGQCTWQVQDFERSVEGYDPTPSLPTDAPLTR